MARHYTLYRITCLPENRIYFGYTSKSLDDRWRRHREYAGRGLAPAISLHGRIAKYGPDAFLVEPVGTVATHAEALAEETRLIAEGRTNRIRHPDGPGLNLSDGGEGNIGPKTQQTRQKIAETLQGHEVSEETREKLRKAHTGQKRTEEHRRKIAEAQKGRSYSDESKQKMATSQARRLPYFIRITYVSGELLDFDTIRKAAAHLGFCESTVRNMMTGKLRQKTEYFIEKIQKERAEP